MLYNVEMKYSRKRRKLITVIKEKLIKVITFV